MVNFEAQYQPHLFSKKSFLSKAWNNEGDVEYDNSTNEFLDNYTSTNEFNPTNIPTGTGGTGDSMFSFLKDYKMFGE